MELAQQRGGNVQLSLARGTTDKPLPADRIEIQQRHLGQQTFDTTAKTERHLHAERAIDTQWNLLMTDGEAGHWFVGAVNDQLGISHQPEGAGLHFPAV